MGIGVRLLLILGAILMMVFVLFKIRRSQLLTSDAIFWFLLSAFFVLIAIFPQIMVVVSKWIGVNSPANLVFVLIIGIVLLKSLFTTVQITQLKTKLEESVQMEALENNYIASENKSAADK